MFAAMIMDYEFYSVHVNKVAQMAPCTITALYMYEGFSRLTEILANQIGLYVMGGPNWPEVVARGERILGREGILGFLAAGWGDRLNWVSMKALYHYA
jgi:hypothetical protein